MYYYYGCMYACYVRTLIAQEKLAEMQEVCKTESERKIGRDAKNRETAILMNACIIFMTVNSCLRTVKLKTGKYVHI